jgi:hypothetical protein
MAKGMLVFVLRSALGDCTNGGVTSKYDKFVLTGPGVPEIFEPSDDAPELILIKRTFHDGPYYHAVPAVSPLGKSHCGPMAGGNFVHTSDSRLGFLKGPISVHDRFETWQEYRRNTI